MALTALLVAFGLLGWLVAADGAVPRLDERAGRAVSGRLPGPAGEFLADLGNAQVVVPVLVLAMACAALHGRRSRAARWWLPPLSAAVSMAAVPVLVTVGKAVVGRPGPPGAGTGGSWPSGHATTAAVGYGLAALLLPAVRGGRVRRLLLAGAVLLTAGVAVGLVVRGYHWPADVLGGWLLSGLLLTAWAGGTAAARRGSTAGASEARGPRPPG